VILNWHLLLKVLSSPFIQLGVGNVNYAGMAGGEVLMGGFSLSRFGKFRFSNFAVLVNTVFNMKDEGHLNQLGTGTLDTIKIV
jgi:hypothetical protein